MEVLTAAIEKYGAPEIFNTDQGSQFTSEVFIDKLKAHQIQISMDGKGRAIDNIFIERFWKTINTVLTLLLRILKAASYNEGFASSEAFVQGVAIAWKDILRNTQIKMV